MGNDWLTIAEVAKRLGMHPDTVYGLTAKGELQATGWPLRVHRSELQAFIERSRVKPGDLRGSNQYAGRPKENVAEWYRNRWKRQTDGRS